MHQREKVLKVKRPEGYSGGGASLSPLYCGFATTPFVAPPALRRWGTNKQADCGEDPFRRFSEIWDSKWAGDGLGDFEENRSLDRTASRFSKACEAKKNRSEKFQLAEGFEDWGIPRYPEDYVDPAEICINSRSLD